MFHAPKTLITNMNPDTPKPVPPLTARTADGKLYKRFEDVEAEIREVWCRPPADWVALKKGLKSETLMFLIRKAGVKDDCIRGQLLAELNVRSVRISKGCTKGLDEILKEEIALEVEAKIFELAWSEVDCAQADYLEVSFAGKVRDLTKNIIPSHRKSVMGKRDQLDVWTGAEASEDLYSLDLVQLEKDVLDWRRDAEEILILLEDETRRDELLRAIYDSVEEPRNFQALYLFEAEEKSLSEIAAHFDASTREVRYWKDTAMRQIRVAFGIETEEKREALRQRRRGRRSKSRAVAAVYGRPARGEAQAP